jgi:hypothetical protein
MEEFVNLMKPFEDIWFDDESHTYGIDEYIFPISGTGWIKKWAKEFDPTGDITRRCASNRGLTVEQMESEWKEISDRACDIGVEFHEYMEATALGEPYEYRYEYTHLSIMGEDYWTDYFVNGDYTMIETEFIVGDRKLEVAGQGDGLVHSMEKGLGIIDYKTSKDINKFSKYRNKMLGIFKDLPECNFIKYSIQISLYAYLLEKNTGIRVDFMEIVWIHSKNKSYEVIQCMDLRDRIKNYFEQEEALW